MPKYKQPETAIHESIEEAWRQDGEIGATRAAIVKYAKVLDMTDSGRDIRPLVTGLFETIDRLKMLEGSASADSKITPLTRILERASNE